MAPILHYQAHRSSYHHVWSNLWVDLINAMMFRPVAFENRNVFSRKSRNKVEPIVTLEPKQDVPMKDSKFETEYVSFPRLVEEEEDDDNDNDNPRSDTDLHHPRSRKVFSFS